MRDVWALSLPFVLCGIKEKNEQTLAGEETPKSLAASADGTHYDTSLSDPESCISWMPEIW